MGPINNQSVPRDFGVAFGYSLPDAGLTLLEKQKQPDFGAQRLRSDRSHAGTPAHDLRPVGKSPLCQVVHPASRRTGDDKTALAPNAWRGAAGNKSRINRGPAANGATKSLQVAISQVLAGDTAAAEQSLDLVTQGWRGMSNKALYHKVIHACAQAGNPQAAVWCVYRMSRVGLRPNQVTFNSVLHACARVGDVGLAAQLWEEMQSLGIEPNAITYNTMMNASTQAHDAPRAEYWMQRMVDDERVTPCVVSFSTVIDACAKCGHLDRAEKWFAQMVPGNVRPDNMVYSSMINACAQAGSLNKAEEWLQRMEACGFVPDDRTFNSLIHASTKAKKSERAEHWLKRMEAVGMTPDKMALGSLVSARTNGGDGQGAEHWLEEMLRHNMRPNLATFNMVLHAYAQSGDHVRATRLFRRAGKIGLSANFASYSALVHAHAKIGNPAEACFWVKKMVAGGFHPDQCTCATLSDVLVPSAPAAGGSDRDMGVAFLAIAEAYASIGCAQGVHRWLGEMASTAARPRLSQYQGILWQCRQSGCADLAGEVASFAAAHTRVVASGAVLDRTADNHVKSDVRVAQVFEVSDYYSDVAGQSSDQVEALDVRVARFSL